ncbi:MAG: RsbRD N-terminal domain-containing protein [Proteobacteria bacterium]|nr:RsbRD N-terminal domain-containing protein [Pseudomonadota bacterium]MBU1743145.1 RsbRD N-terminal domain-containing protein [Pseudomonadota bacterium]
MTLRDQLTRKKKALVEAWIEAAFSAYPAEALQFMKSKKDRFHNPIGHTLSREIEVLFDALLEGATGEETAGPLDRILRLRAIQDFSASQAVGFIFTLKSIVRRELAGDPAAGEFDRELLDLEVGIDRLGLLAFDVYTARRQKIHDIRCEEMRRNHYLLLKRAGMVHEVDSSP